MTKSALSCEFGQIYLRNLSRKTFFVQWESIRKLSDEANVVIPDGCIVSAHRLSANDTVIVRFTTLRLYTMFYRSTTGIKRWCNGQS